KWRQGHHVVLTIRQEDRRLSFGKRFTSKLFYRVMRLLSTTDVRMAAADYRLLSRKALDALMQMREGHLFLRGMVQWRCFSAAEVPFCPDTRKAGVSKYSLRRMLNLAGDGLLSFSRLPLRLATFLGLGVLGLGLVTGVTVGVRWLFGAAGLGLGALMATNLVL